jgi:hypothetical protein
MRDDLETYWQTAETIERELDRLHAEWEAGQHRDENNSFSDYTPMFDEYNNLHIDIKALETGASAVWAIASGRFLPDDANAFLCEHEYTQILYTMRRAADDIVKKTQSLSISADAARPGI